MFKENWAVAPGPGSQHAEPKHAQVEAGTTVTIPTVWNLARLHIGLVRIFKDEISMVHQHLSYCPTSTVTAHLVHAVTATATAPATGTRRSTLSSSNGWHAGRKPEGGAVVFAALEAWNVEGSHRSRASIEDAGVGSLLLDAHCGTGPVHSNGLCGALEGTLALWAVGREQSQSTESLNKKMIQLRKTA